MNYFRPIGPDLEKDQTMGEVFDIGERRQADKEADRLRAKHLGMPYRDFLARRAKLKAQINFLQGKERVSCSGLVL